MVDQVQLSYSSANLLKNCSQKYYWYKVKQVERDPDSEDNQDAFNVGKAFHHVLEMNMHTNERLTELLDEAVETFEVPEHKPMLHAMLMRYLQVHMKSNLKAVHCELGLQNPEFIGYIDVILADDEGNWWICDLKTARRFAETTLARLKLDVQLNLYTSFAEIIAEQLELDVHKFQGCRYRVTTKSSIKRRKTESYKDFVIRCAESIKSYDVIIPIEEMAPAMTMFEHEQLQKHALALHRGEAEPKKNMSYCDSFFRPCEYFSQCYGKTFTELKGDLEVITSDNV